MKVLCIKNYILDNDLIFKMNHYYEVFIEYEDSLWIHPDDNIPFYNVTKFYKTDYIKYNKYRLIPDLFEDYFCKISEARKQKITKLNNIK